VTHQSFYKIERQIRTFKDAKYIDQQSISLYLSRKELSSVAIHDDLVAALGADALSYPSLTRCLGEAISALSNPSDPLPLP
jgi:hypothetical protein